MRVKRGSRVTAKGTRPSNYAPKKRSLHNQAQQLKAEVDEAKAKVDGMQFVGSLTTDPVSATITGDGRIVSLDLDSDWVGEHPVSYVSERIVQALQGAWDEAARARKASVDEVVANTKADLGYIGLDGIV